MRLITFLFLVTLFTFGCSKNNEFSEEITLLVDSSYMNTPSGIYPDKSLNVKVEGTNHQWFVLYNNDIKGFDYEEGYFYRILVRKTFIKSPPQDGSTNSYELIKTLDKSKSNIY